MASKNIVLSLDGATFSILKNYLDTQQLDANSGIGLLVNQGVFLPSTVITPSLTAPSHIAIATGATAARNDINANSFHLIRSPFNTNISGFGAPIGGYDALDSDAEDAESDPHDHSDHEMTTAEPLWLRLREAGKTVVAATFPGADGADVKLPGVEQSPVIQSKEVRTVDYTVPFGAFGGIGARGFSLDAADFTVDAAQAAAGLNTLGIQSFSDVRVAALETVPATGQGSLTGGSTNSYNLQVAAIDTTNDNVTSYDELIVFDANRGIEAATTANAPSTGSAFLNSTDQTISPFYFEGSTNKIGASFVLSNVASDLSTVRLLRTSANYIPRPAESPEVISDVDDINNSVGFWRPQPDFRIAQRLAPGLTDFTDAELEAVYEDLVDTFVPYQTSVLLRSIAQNPDADLVLGYIEQPDGSEHQFLLTDPRQPTNPTDPNSIGAGQDQAKVDRYAEYVLNAYRTTSEAIQQVIDAVGVDENGVPHSNVIVTSDHGFSPFHTAVNMNNILANAGFDPNKVRAVTSGPAVNIYINVKGREPNGTVEPSEYRQLQQQVIDLLEGLQDTNKNYVLESGVDLFDKVYTRAVPENPTAEDIITASSDFIGQDTGDVFALLSLGYNFDGFQETVLRKDDPALAAGQKPIVSVPSFYGAHGFDPNLPEMQAIFLAAGPDFNPGALASLQNVRSIDIAPTVLDILDVEPAPTVEGVSILGLNAADSITGTAEADQIAVTSSNALIQCEDGNDLLNAIVSQGSNTIAAGAGNDILLLGGADRVQGNDGDDRFYVTRGGGNLITGGAGADQFWVATGSLSRAVNTITDFTLGRDVIGIAGLNVGFEQLSILQDGANTRIIANGQDLAILQGVEASQLSSVNFVFV